MVLCLAATRKPLRAQATRYMVGGVTGESLIWYLAGLGDDILGAIHLLRGVVTAAPPFLHLSRVSKCSEHLGKAWKEWQMCSESIAQEHKHLGRAWKERQMCSESIAPKAQGGAYLCAYCRLAVSFQTQRWCYMSSVVVFYEWCYATFESLR